MNNKKPNLVADPTYPGMFRVRLPDGLSDMVNLSRAQDAIAYYVDNAERRDRRRQRAPEAPLVSLPAVEAITLAPDAITESSSV